MSIFMLYKIVDVVFLYSSKWGKTLWALEGLCCLETFQTYTRYTLGYTLLTKYPPCPKNALTGSVYFFFCYGKVDSR